VYASYIFLYFTITYSSCFPGHKNHPGKSNLAIGKVRALGSRALGSGLEMTHFPSILGCC